jgi:hypothetical protein
MASDIWLPLSVDERNLLREALAAYAAIDVEGRKRIGIIRKKLETAGPLPDTVLRVEGGFVEVERSPNAVLVYDYDCDGVEDARLNPDDGGRSCIASEFPPV